MKKDHVVHKNQRGYTIDLVMYLNVADFVFIAWYLGIMIFKCGLAIMFRDDEETKDKCNVFILLPDLCLMIWNFVWSAIALLYIW